MVQIKVNKVDTTLVRLIRKKSCKLTKYKIF